MTTLAIIPARYQSSRFPGKPLVDLKGKPMIQRVWEQAMQAKSLDAVAVATDDLRIKRVVESFGGMAIMTPKSCVSGTDRIAIAARKFGRRASIIVNVQGDEPLLPPKMIDQLVALLKKSKAPMATLCRPLERGSQGNPNHVKVVMDKAGRALYFSRAAIPYQRDPLRGAGGPAVRPYAYVGLHVGIYAYRADFLQKLAKFRPTPLEGLEKLEQLRVLENGYGIAVGVTRGLSVAVDTPADAQKVRRLIR
jgi:3-deoxy-manno-octulosonate cytidylyltransferase (CMP-KDO synthetase)